ncbi:MAG TPA: GTPase Era [Polyangia bacterium]|nr:GTPase Era [Polyangia bacterium]
MTTKRQETRCGYVVLAGRPNAGKSTLLNTILGEKLQIVSATPQTTRNRVLAVHIRGQSQMVFLDTPGIHEPMNSLGRYMAQAVESAITDANICLWLVDAAKARNHDAGLSGAESAVGRQLGESGLPVIALLNKVDLVRPKELLLPLSAAVAALPGIAEVIPISALDGDGVDLVLAAVDARLPASPWLFPEDMLSDRAERFFAAELVREALIELTRQEIPHRAAVVIERFVEHRDRCAIHAAIHVERPSQRGILVGKGGRMIKEIGIRARLAIEHRLGCPVDLRLHVTVTPDWTSAEALLGEVGYE